MNELSDLDLEEVVAGKELAGRARRMMSNTDRALATWKAAGESFKKTSENVDGLASELRALLK